MIKLSEISTRAPKGMEKEKTKALLPELAARIGDLQHIMYAEKKHSLLVVLQGMDAAGKDGATRAVFQDCSPIGINAYGFKKPTEEEMDHDFLWRVHQQVPRKGMITIFNRSHYEDILIQKVHGWIDDRKREQRMRAINSFEQNLMEDNSNTTILKFYMHLSRERQKEKLQERIDNPRKQWKHNDADWKEAELWDTYMACYEYAINNSVVPWIIAPVDQRWYRNYFIATRVLETLESLNMKLPPIKTSK
ncbi:MAG: polyphosphate kinase [Saprospiraceae bacterium]|nr:polyphosphate kinase [Saprospiraceae bacterium]